MEVDLDFVEDHSFCGAVWDGLRPLAPGKQMAPLNVGLSSGA